MYFFEKMYDFVIRKPVNSREILPFVKSIEREIRDFSDYISREATS